MSSRKPVVAIVGSGWGVRAQLPEWRQAGIVVAALWCRTEDKVASLKKEFPDILLITTDYDEILANPEILLISIVTPPVAHKDMALKALRAGKHVLQDKPTALNAQEAAEMYEEAAKRPNQLSLIDHELRFLHTYQKMRTLVQDKENAPLGELRSVEVDVSLQLKADAPWTWWQSEELGGGILGAIGSHYVDLLSWILGDRIVSVGGFLNTLHKERKTPQGEARAVTSDDYASFHVKFSSGVVGIVHIASNPHIPGNHLLRVCGSLGCVQMENSTMTCTLNNESFTEPDAPVTVMKNLWGIATYLLGKELATALSTSEVSNASIPTAATFEDGLYTQKVLDAVRKSSKERKWVDIV